MKENDALLLLFTLKSSHLLSSYRLVCLRNKKESFHPVQYQEQGCQIFRFSALFPHFSAVPLFPAFREFFDALSINRFQETIRKKRIFLGKRMTITMQSLQNHWKEIDMENILRRSREDSTYQP